MPRPRDMTNPPWKIILLSREKEKGEQPSNSCSEQSISSIATQDGCYKSKDHAENRFSKMYKYFLEDELIDVTLIAGDTRIRAHRLVLSSASEYFSAMFTSDLIESRRNEVELYSVCGSALKELVHYCYTGTIELKEDTVESILATASLIGLSQVVEACSIFLGKQLDPSNCIGIALFADARNCNKLRDAAFAYTADFFVDVLKNQEFLMLPHEEVAKLFAHENLNIPSEEIIFNGLVAWVKHDPENRKQHIPKLLEFVKLPLLSPTFLIDTVEPNVGEEGKSHLMEALKYHILPERRNSLRSFRTVPRKSTVGKMYIVGGMDSNKESATTIEVYDARLDQWNYVGNTGTRRLQFGVAAIGKKLIVAGGRDGLKTLNTMECYNIETLTWESLPPMSTHRHGLGLALINESGPLYAVGGHDGWSYLNTVERYNPEKRTWTYVAPMETQRSSLGLVALKDKLYAIGGRDGVSCLRTVEVYDPHLDKWFSCASMSKRRGGLAVAVIGGFIYALGGHDIPTCNPSAARFDCMERYDPKTDTWTNVASMSIGRDAFGVSCLGDKLMAIGGHDGQTHLKLVESYDPYSNVWTQVAPLKIGRAGACVVTIPPSY